MEIPNRQYFLETETFNFSGGDSKSVYHGGTHIGHLKLKNGGMKIIAGKIDDAINEERERVLNDLNDTIKYKTDINPNNIPNYYKALEGTYVRSLICPDDNDEECQKKVDYAVKHGYKLSKMLAKKLKIKSKDYLKENAPKLYQQIKESEYWPKIKELAKKYGAKAIEYGLKSMSTMSKNGGDDTSSVGSRELSETGGADASHSRNFNRSLSNNDLLKDLIISAAETLEKSYVRTGDQSYIDDFKQLYEKYNKKYDNNECGINQKYSDCNENKLYQLLFEFAPRLYTDTYGVNENGGSSSERGGNIYRDRKSQRDSELEELREYKRVSQQGLVEGGNGDDNPYLHLRHKPEPRRYDIILRNPVKSAPVPVKLSYPENNSPSPRSLRTPTTGRISYNASPPRRNHSGGSIDTDDQSLEQLRIELGR